MSGAPSSGSEARSLRLNGVARLLPGLCLAAAGAALAALASSIVPALSMIVVGLALGLMLANTGVLPAATEPGLRFAAKPLLRLGVVLLGFRLALPDVLRLGADGLAIVVGAVAVTLAATLWLGRRLRVSPHLTVLTAAGFAICGASAVAAMREVIDADEDDTAFAVGLVTIFGTVAILALPLLSAPLGLDGAAYGQWVGASVHDVGQVVAAAAAGGSTALTVAVVVKLTRVLLLGPLLIGAGLLWRRRADAEAAAAGTRPPLVPLFVAGFLAAVAARTTGLVPEGWLGGIETAGVLVLTAALVGIGSGVRLARLRAVGGRPLLLGALAWLLIAGVALAGVLAVAAWR